MQLRKLTFGVVVAVAVGSAQAVTVFSEGFNDVSTLAAAGWVQTNNSASASQAWFQGNTGVFNAFSGAGNSYIAANYLSSGSDTGAISNWLITPLVSLSGGETLSFYARTDSTLYSDALTVRLSTTGSATSTFTTTLLTLPSLTSTWTLYSVVVPTLGAATNARIAFEYAVASASNADYIGVDSVVITTAVPEPTSLALLGLGLAGLVIRRRVATSGDQA